MNDDKNLNTTDIDVDKNLENEFVNQDTNKFDETNSELQNTKPEENKPAEEITNNTPRELNKPKETPEFVRRPAGGTIRNIGNYNNGAIKKATIVRPGSFNMGASPYQNNTETGNYSQASIGSNTMLNGEADGKLRSGTITAGETAEKTGDTYSKVGKNPITNPRKPVSPVVRRKRGINKGADKSKETRKKGTDLNKDNKKLAHGKKIGRSNRLQSLSRLSNLANLKNRINSANNINGNKKNTADDKKKKKIVIKSPKKRIIMIAIILGIFLSIGFLFLFIVFITSIFSFGSSGSGMSATAGYYPIDCEDVTVIFVDKSANYAVTGSGTYPIDEYVAGVLQGEVGEFQNLEIYKQFAIAARSYFLRNQSNCTIEASDRKQVFREITSSNTNTDLMRQAAQETSGIVLLDGNGQLVNSEYDAFCSIAVDANYYTIKQQNQKIPRNWVDSQGGIAASWKRGDCSGNHGRGMSQWGSYYLATEENYTYDNLISYYLGNDNVSISSKGILATIVDLAIKSTTDAVYQLDQSLPGFLASKGSSLEEYNNYIRSSVEKAGVGTREGVVAAAVSSITFLYDNFNTKLPYYWGGHYTGTIGIPSSFGNSVPSIPSPSGKRYPYISFDCSGFVNWAIVNGGYKFSDTNNYASKFSGCNITNSSCTGQPGDIIDSPSHVVMIVSVDETNNKYYVAESTVSGVIIQTRGMHDRMSGENTQVLHLDSLYNNKANVNSNY